MEREVNTVRMNVVVMDIEDDLFRISFCDNPSRPNHYLIMEQAKEYSTQDKKMEMDSFYIEVDGQQNCQYGGVDRVELADSDFTFHFSPNSNLHNSLRLLRFATDPAKATEAFDFIERHFQLSIDRR